MIRFLTLGPADLRGADGVPVDAVLAQPKRTGVLLVLTLGTGAGGFVRRDTLLPLFWPDSPEEKARNSLRQAVHQLRRALGEEVITGRGTEELGLDHDRLWCDAVAFSEALAAGRLEEALGMYRGDLAAGLHVAGCPEFAEWLDGERRRLRREAIGAAGRLADAATAAGDVATALGWARRAVALAPLEEEPARRLITLLDQAGDRGGALAEFELLASRLRRELEVAPSAETRSLVATLRARPAEPRHTPLAIPIPTLPEDLPPPATPAPAPRPKVPRVGRVALLAALLILVLGALWPIVRGPRAGGALDPTHVVVAPFRVSGAAPSLAYLREGMVDLLAMKLGDGGPLGAVDPRAVLGTWRQFTRGTDADLGPDAAREVAGRLGAGRIVLGSAVGTEAHLTLSARLLDVRGGAVRASAEVQGPADSLPALIDRLVAGLLLGEVQGAPDDLAERTTASLPALRAWLAGRFAYRRGDYALALARFTEATTLDSTFALAWLWRADASDWMADRGQRIANAAAVALRDRLGPADRAYLTAVVGPGWPGETTPMAQLKAWEDVVRLAPDRPEGWFGLGDELFHLGAALGADSGFVRAEAAFERAHRLDSTYVAPLTHLVYIALLRPDAALLARATARLGAADSSALGESSLALRVALATGDSAAVARFRARLPVLEPTTLIQIATWSMLEGVDVGDGLRASQLHLAGARSVVDRIYALNVHQWVVAAVGRFGEYERGRAELALRRVEPASPLVPLINAMAADGDSLAAEAALAGLLAAPDPRQGQLYGMLWRAWHGAALDSTRFAALLPAEPHASPEEQAWIRQLELLALGLRRCAPGDPGAPAAVEQLEAWHEAHAGGRLEPAHFVLADCYARLGRPADAARLLRGRPIDFWAGLPMLPRALRLEGRYALAAGDTAGARRAWRHYLALRAFADSSVQGYAAEVRAALARLGG